MNALADFFSNIWRTLDTPFTLPWIGTTSILKIEIFLAVLGLLVYLVRGLLGGNDDD